MCSRMRYDDLVALTDDPVRQDPAAVLGRAVAVGHVLGAAAGLRETDRLREVLGERHRWHAVRGHLHELGGDLPAAATAYAEAARRATRRRPPRLACRQRSASGGSARVAGCWPRGVNLRCLTRHQSADTKRTHQKRHARRLATHVSGLQSRDLQEKVRRS
jgi:hypothetical protein